MRAILMPRTHSPCKIKGAPTNCLSMVFQPTSASFADFARDQIPCRCPPAFRAPLRSQPPKTESAPKWAT
jgi:hypothetical protein